jgi:hypothetical protein
MRELTSRTVTGIREPSSCQRQVMPCFLASTPVRREAGDQVGGEAAVARVRTMEERAVGGEKESSRSELVTEERQESGKPILPLLPSPPQLPTSSFHHGFSHR